MKFLSKLTPLIILFIVFASLVFLKNKNTSLDRKKTEPVLSQGLAKEKNISKDISPPKKDKEQTSLIKSKENLKNKKETEKQTKESKKRTESRFSDKKSRTKRDKIKEETPSEIDYQKEEDEKKEEVDTIESNDFQNNSNKNTQGEETSQETGIDLSENTTSNSEEVEDLSRKIVYCLSLKENCIPEFKYREKEPELVCITEYKNCLEEPENDLSPEEITEVLNNL